MPSGMSGPRHLQKDLACTQAYLKNGDPVNTFPKKCRA